MEELKMLFDEFNEKPIAYNRVYSKITGGVTTGLLLSQLVYWAKAMNYEEFYKTDNDFSEELGMGLYELRGAKKRLSELGLIKLERKGVPAKTYYTVDADKIIHLITRLRKNHKLDCGNSTNKSEEKPQTNTETNTETTQREEAVSYETAFSDSYKTKYDIAKQRGQQLKKQPRSTKQENVINRMKLVDYFKAKASDYHGKEFFSHPDDIKDVKKENTKIAKLLKDFYRRCDEDMDKAKEVVDFFLGSENYSWSDYRPAVCFRKDTIQDFENQDEPLTPLEYES